MHTLTLIRENNFFTKYRAFKVYIDGKFIDFIEPDEKRKTIEIPNESLKLNIKLDRCSSNTINLQNLNSDSPLNLRITSQIQNGLFIFIAITFFGGGILNMLGYIGPILGFASIFPMAIIVFWQTIGRKKLMRITKSSDESNLIR